MLQLALTGGEPMLRRDLDELCAGARDAGLYSSLITAGTLFTRERARGAEGGRARPRPDLDPEPGPGGERPHRRQPVVREEDRGGARCAKELDFPLTINCVLHRQNLDRVEEMLELALELGAQRLELANTQYYGWAVPNQAALMPTREQLERAEEAVQRFRERVGPKVDVLWVLPDFYEDLPKPCMGGWGRTAMVIAPNGDVLPCQAAATIPGLEFANVRDHSLEWIWNESDAFDALPRHRLDAGAVPVVPARAPGGGLRRLPLPGAAARRRRGGDRSGLPLLAPPRPRRRGARAGAVRRVRLPHDEAAARASD